MIYFVGNGKNQVKIGYAQKPFERLKALQTASPDKLEILAIAPGKTDKEKFFHDKYDACHINGEWFELTKELELEIKVLQSCFSVVEESTDDSVVVQDRFAAWIEETEHTEEKYNPLIERLEKEIEELERQRDIEIDKLDEKYFEGK